MKQISLVVPLALYLFSGCGGSTVVSSESSNFIRSVGKELHLVDFKDHYFVGEVFDGVIKAVDEYGADISRQVVMEGVVDTSREGRYSVVYKLLDSRKNVVDIVEKEIVVSVNKKPVISLYGDQVYYLYLDHTFDEPGYEAIDAEEGDISSRVKISGNIDNTAEGTYYLTYQVSDSFGNQTTIQRIIRVIPPDDIRAEVLEADSGSALTTYHLWDYMVSSSSADISYTFYRDNLKEHSQTNTIIPVTEDIFRITLPYTLRTLSYVHRDDNSIKINFEQESDILKTVTLKNEVHIDDVITSITPQDDTKSCKLSAHFDLIKLSDVNYSDVIKIVCGKEEAYFEKGKGIILVNEHLLANNGFSTYGSSSEDGTFKDIVLKTITQKVKVPLGENNLESMIQSHADMLANDPYNLHGNGIRVGIVDEGAVRSTHTELAGRVTNLTSEDIAISEHTTHVAGTIAAAGINTDARGYANQAKLEILSYAEDNMYFSYAIDALHRKGIDISNHSYGEEGNSKAGLYDQFAHLTDKLIENNQYILAVAAAGNDRGDEGYADYGIIKDFANAKNIITVGAVNYDGTLTSFSSTGPVKNGRIKPDIVAKGYRVLSLDIDRDDGYQYMSGTSMAAPAVTGAMVLLEEEYLKVNHEKMREDVAKAIITNSAEDLGRTGPDYEYGFGLLNTLEAVKIIDSMKSTNSLVQMQKISAEQKHIYDLHLDQLTTFKTTLCWIDPVTDFVPTEELISDLDVTIVDENFQVVYPFSLDPDNPENLAVQNGFNRVDNVEQIVTKLPKGDYKVIVTVHKAGKAQQQYALVSSMALKNFTVDSSYSKINEFETKIYESIAQ